MFQLFDMGIWKFEEMRDRYACRETRMREKKNEFMLWRESILKC